MASDGDIRLAISDGILEEIVETLRRKFRWPESNIAEAIETLRTMTELVVPAVILDVVKHDPDDNRILECAQSAHSECIVTGDRDLLRLQRYDGMPIMTVSEFLNRVGQTA